MFAAMNSLTNALVTEDTAAWLGFLDAQDKVRPGGIGCIGYCMSGRYVTTVTARFPNRFAASASLYGVGIVTEAEDSPHLLVDRIKGEMYFGFAETDEHVPANVIPTLKSALDKAGTRYGLDVFPNSRHGFQFPERDVYETHAAEESWSKVVTMWDRNLNSGYWMTSPRVSIIGQTRRQPAALRRNCPISASASVATRIRPTTLATKWVCCS
jgi:carboxymethylenebutenolidase